MDAGRDVRVHDRGQASHHRGRVGDQVDAAVAIGAVGHVVIRKRAGVDVFAADQRGVAVQHPEFAVLIAVPVVDAGGRVRAEIVDAAARLDDLLHDPALLIADPAGWRAFQDDLDVHARAGARGDQLAQTGVLQRVAFEPDALRGAGQQRVQGGEGVVGRDEHRQGGGFGDDLWHVEALQIPARKPGLAAVDDVARLLRPVCRHVGVRHGPPGVLIQLAIEDLALLAEVGRGAIRFDGRTGPASGRRVAGLVDEGVRVRFQRCQQHDLPAGVGEPQCGASQVGHGGIGVRAIFAPRTGPKRSPKGRGLFGAPKPGVRGQG